jgi:hypothetical protein
MRPWVQTSVPLKKKNLKWHLTLPSYSGGRDQEDCSSKPAQANSWWDPFQKTLSQKTGLVEWFKVKALSSRSSTTRKIKKQLSLVSPTPHPRKYFRQISVCSLHFFHAYIWNVCIHMHTFSFSHSRVWTSGLTLDKQALYHLSHTPTLFCFSYFSR